MTQLTANVSPLIPQQFPAFYREQNQDFIAFVQAYYAWLEQEGNAQYYSRNYYTIKDIDSTFDQFISHFKQKYLNNIPFPTITNIRTVIKHALDIYRSKGTQRCTKLLFQLVYDKTPEFYYPSTDLFKLSDGVWRILSYLELTPNWNNNVKLQSKEITGAFSGATAFVDSLIRRNTNGRFEDVAYISAVTGLFQAGEKVVPNDGSLSIDQCPSIMGSLVDIDFSQQNAGENYTVGNNIPVSSTTGTAGIFQVSKTVNITGLVDIEFGNGGWGYALNYPTTTIDYVNSTGVISVNTDIFTYFANGVVNGKGYITAQANTVVANGAVTVLNLQGNLHNANVFYTIANTVSANIKTYSTVYTQPNVHISNATLTISNLLSTSANNEIGQYFRWMDTITEPMATLNYVNANGTFNIGDTLHTYNVGTLSGDGVIMEVTPLTGTSGAMVVSVRSGTMDQSNAIYTVANTIGANLSAVSGYTDTTVSANYIANSDVVTITVENVFGTFIAGEEIFQEVPHEGPIPDLQEGGWGIVQSISSPTTLVVNSVMGKFASFQGRLQTLVGAVSGASADVVSAEITVGVINASITDLFIASPYSYCYGPVANGTVAAVAYSGTGLSAQIANSLLNSANISVNVDKMSDYAAVVMSASSYGFPSNPQANSTSGSMASCMNMLNLTVGELDNIIVSGFGQNFTTSPFIVVDEPAVSAYNIQNDILGVIGSTGTFLPGEIMTQTTTATAGQITKLGNNDFLEVQRYSFTNNFVATTTTGTQIMGQQSGVVANVVSVDYDYFNTAVMGRNATTKTVFSTGNNAIANGIIITSGFGFANGEPITVGANGATGTAVIGGVGKSQGYYEKKGGFLSDQKKLFDGWYWQNFSYEVISPLMLSSFQEMIQDITHPAGTILFGRFVHNSQDGSGIDSQKTVVNIS